MAHNRQLCAKLPNNNNLVQTINGYLTDNYIIHQIINLAPVSNEILVIYYDPALEPETEDL
jgi:hypothetical protein